MQMEYDTSNYKYATHLLRQKMEFFLIVPNNVLSQIVSQ